MTAEQLGAVKQRADCGNQHDIVGPDQFPQRMRSFRPGCGGGARVRDQAVDHRHQVGAPTGIEAARYGGLTNDPHRHRPHCRR